MKGLKEKLKTKKHNLWVVAVLLIGMAFGYWLNGSGPEAIPSANQPAALASQVETVEAEKNTLYACPMMCVPPMETPGDCPVCGMELIPVGAGEKSAVPRLKLSPETMKLAQIQVAPVERKFVSAEIALFGQIDYDPAHITNITAFMPGVIDRVYIRRAGQFVRWGDPLFDIYSSDLLTTMQQLAEAMKHVPSFYSFRKGRAHIAKDAPIWVNPEKVESGQKSPEFTAALKTIEAVRYKLRILGLPKRDIDELLKAGEPTGIATVYASMYGQVVEQNAFEGTYINTGTSVFTIADPEYVWAKLDVYEVDYPWIRKGQKLSFVTDAYPGETFKGKIVYIDPVFNVKTRTFTISALSPDMGGRLKAGMIVRAILQAHLSVDGKMTTMKANKGEAPLVIPASAPLITGKRSVVYVAVPDAEGVFEGREVILGPKAGDHYVVLGGLQEGDRVVVNGNFKIDSQMQILAKSSMMSIEGGDPVDAHHHHGGSQVMDQDYMDERMKSRMQRELTVEHPDDDESETDRRHGQFQQDRKSRNKSQTHRRRPGRYGDTTRKIPTPWSE
jgi:membrane fusion protein, copper/silver efflux system